MKLDPSEISKSSVRSHVTLTHPITQPVIRVDSPTLLNTILSSHRNLRRKALQTYFTSLTPSQIACIFPLTSTRSMDLILFWRTKESGKLGHHYVPDLSVGTTVDLLGKTLELVKDKAGGMYQESQLQQRLLVNQLQNSEYGKSLDPIAVVVTTCQQFIEWDFEGKGPLTVPVTFTLKNLSTTSAAEYKLDLLREDFHSLEQSSASPGLPGTWSNWVGKLNHSGRLEKLEKLEIKCSCWFFGPGMMSIGDWRCTSSYSSSSSSLPSHPPSHSRDLVEDLKASPVWVKSGSSTLVSVSDAPAQSIVAPPSRASSHAEL